MATPMYIPGALSSLRDSFALHLNATKAPKTAVIYLAALDSLIRHLESAGLPTAAPGIKREHIESWMAARRHQVKPASLSLQFRALVQFFRWAVQEAEIEHSPMEKIGPPRVPDAPIPVIEVSVLRRLFRACEGKGFNERRDAAVLLFLYDSGVRL